MGREPSTSDLLFLLSLGALGAGCPGGDDAATADDGASTSVGTSGGATAGASTGEGTGTTGTSGSTGSETVGAVDSSGTTGEPECGEFPYAMGEVGEGCIGYVAMQQMCSGEPPLSPECLAYAQAQCQYIVDYSVMAYGVACGMAYEEVFACLSQLTCEEFESVDACPDQAAAVMASCM